MARKRRNKKIKHINLKVLHKKAWKLISEYVRRSEKGICYTCGKHNKWQNTDCGHYIHHNNMDFVLMNLNCQCIYCNKFQHGNLGIYAERLIAEFGEPAVVKLRELDINTRNHKFTIFELEELIKIYTQRLKEIEG